MSNVIDTVFLGDVIVNLVDACPIELLRAMCALLRAEVLLPQSVPGSNNTPT